jgi:predicted unusual protein kinase regulating ubiquinone biosynthesis (AarF/ABC1/UbiB family)
VRAPAQVHRGRLHDGREIVVKVQHEGMEARCSDTALLLAHV